MNKVLGKIVAGLMAIALIITGSCLFGANSSEVLADDTTTTAFHTEQIDVSGYIDAEGNRTAPKPTASGYEDWIFAGWYRDADCTQAVNSKSGTRYAKFVPSEILSVKCQVTAGTKAATTQTSSLRLISTVDSLNYNEVGFEVSFDFGAKSLEIPTYNVFKKIESAVEGQEYRYSPNIFDLQSEYFVTATMTNIDNQNFDDGFYIRPYWKTLDGTKVYGVSRCARVEDSYLNIVNVPVRLYSDASVTGGNVTVTYDSNLFEYVAGGYSSTLMAGTTTSASYDDPTDLGMVTVDGSTAGTISVAKRGSDAIDADGMFVNLRFKRKADEANLPKKNEFTVAQSLTVADSKTVVVPNVTHTHYHTAYNGTPDTAWWNNRETGQTKFVITSPAELYGVASLTANGTGFTNYTIYLGSDIKVNNGTVNEWKAQEPTYKWVNTIGNSTQANFNGTFDGQGHTINGIYMSTSSENAGLFGVTNTNSTIKNFKLVNSYFKSTASYLGSIVGKGGGKLESVYSEATVEGSTSYCGGLVGIINNGENTGKNQFVNCCFAGTISGKDYLGGILGAMGWNGIQTKVVMNNCLSKGNIMGTSNNIGGFCGGVLCINSNVNTLDMNDCLNSSVVRVGTGLTACNSSIIGRVHGTSIANLTDIYTTDDVKTSDGKDVANQVIGVGSVSGSAVFGGEDKKAQIIDVTSITGLNTTEKVPDLDYTNYWVAKSSGVPELKSFATANTLCYADTDWYYANPDAKEFIIHTREELYGLSKIVNSNKDTFEGQKIILASDIIINSGNSTLWVNKQPVYSWIPIGASYPFRGIFDGEYKGKIHSIQGVYVNTPNQYAGLFGVTYYTSEIRNLRLENSYIKSTNTDDAYIGGITGAGGGTLETVYSDATVVSAGQCSGGLIGGIINAQSDKNFITQCCFEGKVSVTGNKGFVGGIVGLIGGSGTKVTIRNCLSNGSVSSAYNNTAGVCGGLLTANTLDLIDCLNASVVRVGAGLTACNSSIIGRAHGTSIANFTNVYTTDDVKTSDGQNVAYQVIGVGSASGSAVFGGDGKAAIKSIDQLTGAQARYNTALVFYLGEDNDGVWMTRKNKTLALKNFVPANEWYTADETIVADKSWHVNKGTSQEYIIMTAAELYGLSEIVAAQENGFNQDTVRLGANIVVNNGDAKTWSTTPAVNSWTPIGNTTQGFVGTFDGQGYTISGLYTKTPSSYVGLFGHASNNAAFRNVRLVNTYFEQSDASAMFLGSILGNADNGSINNVYSDAILVSAGGYVGGIIGRVGGGTSYPTYTLNNCWYAGDIISPKQYLGGILGVVFRANINITNALFTGTITSTYADKTSGARVGGLCSNPMEQSVLNIADCISAGKISDNCNGHTVGSIVGRLSAGKSDVNITNVFATVECSASTFGSVDDGNENKDDILGTVVRATETDRLIGFCTEKTGEALDFENDWVMRTSGVPVLKCFDDLVTNKVVVADGTTLDATLTAELGLDMNIFGSYTMKNAVNYGLGNYQISVPGITLEQYNGASGYLKKLESLGFELYVTNADSTMDDDGVYNAIYTKDEGNWVVNVTYSNNTQELNININTGGKDSLSKDLIE